MAYDFETKVDCVYRLTVKGESAASIRRTIGPASNTLKSWAADPVVCTAVEALRNRDIGRGVLASGKGGNQPRASAAVDPSAPIIDTITRARLLKLIRETPVPVRLALQYCRLSPNAFTRWEERAGHDAEARELVLDIRQALAESAVQLMPAILNGKGRGAMWALARALPSIYGDTPEPESVQTARDPGESLGRIMAKYAAR